MMAIQQNNKHIYSLPMGIGELKSQNGNNEGNSDFELMEIYFEILEAIGLTHLEAPYGF